MRIGERARVLTLLALASGILIQQHVAGGLAPIFVGIVPLRAVQGVTFVPRVFVGRGAPWMRSLDLEGIRFDLNASEKSAESAACNIDRMPRWNLPVWCEEFNDNEMSITVGSPNGISGLTRAGSTSLEIDRMRLVTSFGVTRDFGPVRIPITVSSTPPAVNAAAALDEAERLRVRSEGWQWPRRDRPLADTAGARDFLAKNAPSLESWDRALERPRFEIPRSGEANSVASDFWNVHRVANAVVLRAQLREEAGDLAGAIEGEVAAFALAELALTSLEQDQFSLGFGSFFYTIAHPSLTSLIALSERTRLLRDEAQIVLAHSNSLAKMGDRWLALGSPIDVLEQRMFHALAPLRAGNPFWPVLSTSGGLINRLLGPFVESIYKPKVHDRLAAWTHEWNNWLAVEPTMSDHESAIGPTAFTLAQLRSLAALRVVGAVQLYAAERGRFPERSEELLRPELPAMPIDPVEGLPLEYALEDGRAIVRAPRAHDSPEPGKVLWRYQGPLP